MTILQELDFLFGILSDGATAIANNAFYEHKNRFSKFIQETKRTELSMRDIDLEIAEDYVAWMRAKKLAVKTMNASITYIKKYFKYGIKKKLLIKNNFEYVDRVDYRTVEMSEQAERFEPLTSEELKKIFEELEKSDNKPFMRFCSMILYAFFRPVEVTRLQVGDIDLAMGSIRSTRQKSKNKKAAMVQIIPPLHSLLSEMDLSKYEKSMYVFSGEGFMPGHKKLWRDQASERWLKIVKHSLEINKDMYGLKHTGNLLYLQMNKGKVDLKWLQSQNRHSSISQTETYVRQLGAYFRDIEDVQFWDWRK